MHFPICALWILELLFGNLLVDLDAMLFNFQMCDIHVFHIVNYDFDVIVHNFNLRGENIWSFLLYICAPRI
jgi:hypothetical protein